MTTVILVFVCLISSICIAQPAQTEQFRSADDWYNEALRLSRSVSPNLEKALYAYNQDLPMNPTLSPSAYYYFGTLASEADKT
jgi:hypothetical protein